MQLLSRSKFRLLAQTKADPCVSLYLSGHTPHVSSLHQREQMACVLQDVSHQLEHRHFPTHAIQHFLKPVEAFLQQTKFQPARQESVALYLTPDGMHTFRLPLALESQVWVGDRFYLKPLMPLLAGRTYGYMLTLSEQHIQFYQVTATAISKISLCHGFSAVKSSLNPAPISSRSPLIPANSRGFARLLNLEKHETMRRICAQVNATLHTYLSLEEAPLLLLAEPTLQDIYGSINTYFNLATLNPRCNPDTLSQEQLQAIAWKQIEPSLRRSQQDDSDQFRLLQLSGHTSTHLEQIIPAAYRGQIKTLFVTAGRQCWGQVNATSHDLEQINDTHPQDMNVLVDLLDAAAMQTFLQGGTVYTLPPEDMPALAPIAAIYHPPVRGLTTPHSKHHPVCF